MKRIAIIILAAVLCLSLIACGEKKEQNSEDTTVEETTRPAVERVENEDGGYTVYNYNEKGQMTKSETYNEKDELVGYTETVFEDGKSSKRIWYNADGEIIREMEIQ